MTRPALTLGRVDRIRLQVGFRETPDGPAYEQYLLDLPPSDTDDAAADGSFDDGPYLAALEPVVSVVGEKRRHYSLHEHRWHTSWGPATGGLDLGITVTTGAATRRMAAANQEATVAAFDTLLAKAPVVATESLTRKGAVIRARSAVAAAYALDPDALVLTVEQHDAGRRAWRFALSDSHLDRYDVTVGFLDGYAGSVHVRHEAPDEVHDSVGID